MKFHLWQNSVSKVFRDILCPNLKKVYQKVQWNQFEKSTKCSTLQNFRCSWYHDPLLHQLKDPMMRIIRKCRLGVSELLVHSHHLNPFGGKVCPHCNSQKYESLKHFFLECSAFEKQRCKLIRKVKPILKKLGLPLTAKSLLGFDDRLTSIQHRKSSHSDRISLYSHTCEFMRSTNRFEYI